MLKNISISIKLTLIFLLLSTLTGVAILFYHLQSLRHLQQLVPTAPGTSLDAAFQRLLSTGFLVTALAITSATLLGILIAIQARRSLGTIKTHARQLANGDLSRRLPDMSRDELGEVALQLNRMATHLQHSYQRDEAILQSMSEGLIAMDKDGRVVLLNGVARDTLELGESSETVGRDAYAILPLLTEDKKAPIAKEETPMFTALANGSNINEVFAFRKKQGRCVLLNIVCNPIVVDRKTEGAVVTLRDVTHEKELDHKKTEFISLASHQLRTPLSAIKWYSEMLLSGDAGGLKGDQLEFASSISSSTERMIQVVNSLLNISRIESGRILIDPKPTDLRELVEGIVKSLKPKIEERRHLLAVSVHADLPKINIDSRLISQVYLNLLTNAIKYTPKGGEISIFISKKDDDIISQVTDNGLGIPKDQQRRLFQKFFRATNAAKAEPDGTGLGLYLVKAIIESSGGKIWFESDTNQGTTFWFSFPVTGMKAKEGEVTFDT